MTVESFPRSEYLLNEEEPQKFNHVAFLLFLKPSSHERRHITNKWLREVVPSLKSSARQELQEAGHRLEREWRSKAAEREAFWTDLTETEERLEYLKTAGEKRLRSEAGVGEMSLSASKKKDQGDLARTLLWSKRAADEIVTRFEDVEDMNILFVQVIGQTCNFAVSVLNDATYRRSDSAPPPCFPGLSTPRSRKMKADANRGRAFTNSNLTIPSSASTTPPTTTTT
ncbi:hypothetical protein K457DRAFT_18529 [Linnemannia elongata AG-77]|uniref:Uncharacterized protein n=1 Tax=Linnemannia elongata AG-77 TaxID=1314771 RepID=A0A197K141_9FUNG|nr:hypothetical protein K457DRAFT_18529 [Linnemannia elongata AG-77]